MNVKQLPKKPHSAGYLLGPPYDQTRMAQNRSQQAPKKNLGVVYNAPIGPLFNQPLQPQQQAQTQDALKRKKMREVIFGSRAPGSTQYNNKEDIANHYRNLKIKTNITLDENVRLKTKVQQIQSELNQRDKELEKLTLRLQQNLSGEIKMQGGNYAESFLVSQLKRSTRDLKLEIQEKDRLIDNLKRNIRLSKTQEIEVELTVYIEECLRLRQ